MQERKEIVGYVRTYREWDMTCLMQEKMILKFCHENDMRCKQIFCDRGNKKNRSAMDVERAKEIGISTQKWNAVFPEWEKLMLAIKEGWIGCILVDTVLRLYCNQDQKHVLERLCQEHNVQVIEVGNHSSVCEMAKPKLAIYNYSVQPEERTTVTLKDIDSMYDFASQHYEGWEVSLFLDLNLKRRENLVRVLNTNVDVILVKSFFHIKRKTISFMNTAKILWEKNIKIVSVEEGRLDFIEDKILLENPMKIAIYDRFRSEHEREIKDIQIAKFETFVKCKTNGWIIDKAYIDDLGNDKQPELEKLLREANQFDLILTDTFGKLGDTIICLKDILRKIPVYSLKEGAVVLYE